MQAKQCLFYKESGCCSDTSTKEHIIQEGLAGTLRSSKIICANCNSFFSQELDVPLVKLYELIIARTLSPLLSGKLKKRKITIETNSKAQIEYINGVASLSQITKEYSSDGKVEEYHAPLSTPLETLQKIAHSKGRKIKSYREMPLTKAFPDINEENCFKITPPLMRSIQLNVLELAYYVHITKGLPNIAQHSDLDELRLWIRTGSMPHLFSPYSFASISDMIDSLFEASIFSHRIIINFDHKSKTLVLVAQFVNTMPWVFIHKYVDLNSSSMSILYQKALLDGSDKLTCENNAVLNIKDVEWCQFSTKKLKACEFAQKKWLQDYVYQYKRAHYERDLRHDKDVIERLERYSNNYRDNNSAVNGIVKLIENRYLAHPNVDKILATAKENALKKLTDTAPNEQKSLIVYRECLKKIKNNFGYPVVLSK